MKLISLLKIIPDECTIRLANFEDCCVGDVGTKDDVIAKNDKLTVVEKASLKGEKEMEEDSKFKVGYRVFYPYHGLGTVIANHNDGRLYPIDVKWDKSPKGCEVSTFTKDGFLVVSLGDCGDNDKLTVIGKASVKKKDKKSMAEGEKIEVGDNVWSSKRDNVWSSKREVDSINPAHYRVKGIPEAYDIMTHLMTREQLEGFFWGNIIKYAYRYGRKGDEAETAGKIAWYAQKLKELGECESE